MKTKIKLFASFLLAGTLLVNCTKDDEENNSKNYLKIGDTEYDLSDGIIDNYGTDDGDWYLGYNTDLTLISDGFTIETNGYLTGKGDGIVFEMFSETGTALDNGDYEFTTIEPCAIGTFDYGSYVIGYDMEEDEGESTADIAGGTVSVSKSGDVYTITFDCTSKDGEKISGFYEGELKYADMTTEDMYADLKSNKSSKSSFKKQ